MKEGDIIDYKIRQLKGITDLEGLPEQGSEWWSEETWKKWNEDEPARNQRNADYIAKAKADGTYGEEYFFTISLQHNPLFDSPQLFNNSSGGLLIPNAPLQSFRMVFLNDTKDNKDETI